MASTKPAMPVRREVVDEVLHPGEVGVAGRRHAVLPAQSSRSRSPPQSLMLNGGLARMKSAFRSGCRSSWKVSACCGPRLASMPRIARFILARRQVVGFDSWP